MLRLTCLRNELELLRLEGEAGDRGDLALDGESGGCKHRAKSVFSSAHQSSTQHEHETAWNMREEDV